MSRLKRAVIVGFVCGGAATAWLAIHGGVTREESGSGSPMTRDTSSSRKGMSRFMPWSFALDVREDAKTGRAARPDPYRGPRMLVTVTVLDDEGQPVPGAIVEARAFPDDYEVAGLTDEEYDVWAAEQDAAAEAEAEEYAADAEGEGEIEETWLRVVVESGRTDRKGTWQAMLKPDADVVFHARAGKREGVSNPITTWTRDELENPVDGTEDEGATESGVESEYGSDDGYARAPNAVTIEIAAAAVLAGTVHDENGNPVDLAYIDLAALSGEEHDYRSLEDMVVAGDDGDATRLLQTGPDGSFRIPVRAYGAFDVTVEAEGLRQVTQYAVQLMPGHETTLNVTLPMAAQLAGVVLDGGGTPLTEAYVKFTRRGDDVSRSWGTGTGVDGSFLLQQLESAEGELTVSAEGYLTRVVSRVLPGGGAVEVRLDRDDTVAELVPPLTGSESDGQPLSRVSMEGVAISFEPAGYPEDGIDYEEEEELVEELFTPDVRIEPTSAGVIVLAARPSPNGRLFGGDRVVSIDGQSIGDMDEWEAVELLDGPKGSRCRIVVERPATRQMVAVDLERVVPQTTY